ncbi:MAG: competence protein ComEC, partial [Caulobacteraceae bacterium]
MAEQAAAQAERWVLWTPVAFGAGAASYFALRDEPTLILAAGMAVGAVMLACAARLFNWRRDLAAVAMLLAAAMFGFADGALSTGMARAPLIREGQGVSQVQGWVVDVASSSA